ncbi:hypothetical protein ACOB3W_003584 [Vibrio cholerae]|uniref:hypothetical protein n=1 Tax=Vibrio cholerae TaxID=666 RepID=UPI0029D7E847|nr:hypothetical protein [Vibrio cholerae]EHK7543230.1 hypothetical protein [Vibrio cholerae]EII3094196.1 hypothetical protein [Vibrio cholerae]EKF9639357.1 hypothetical protein [Vibrio cholerae]HEJ2462734.1 hypothetical protein [Vibrio cholerae]
MEHFTDRLREPLNETTRKARRNLLAVSVLGIVTTKVGLVPTKISAFGVEFSSSNLESLMTLLALAIIYFLVTFVVYIISELQGWQLLISSKQLEKFKQEANGSSLPFSTSRKSEMEEHFHIQLRSVYSKTKPIFYTRLLVEVFIPAIVAVYSIIATTRMDVLALMAS